MALLTKSRYVIGLQCPTYLWMATNDKKSLPEPTESEKHIMDQGTGAGKLATKVFPKGINIPTDIGFMENIHATKEALKKGKPVFEAGIMANKCYSRADILIPVKDKWDVIEVKATTKVKDEHIDDVAFQKFVYEMAGLKIRQCYLMHLNKEYVRKGKIDVEQLFVKENITNDVKKAMGGIEDRVAKMLKIINSDKPKAKIHYYCDKPYKCPLMKDCWDFLPDENVFHLSRGRKNAFDLFSQGVVCLKDIPMHAKLTDKQCVQKDCAVNGCVRVNKIGIKNFLKKLKYPLYHLDFETFSLAVPLMDGTKCWQQIPFQYSLHVEDDAGHLEHHSFVASSEGDPRPEFAEYLKKALKGEGSIVVYNKSFEKMILTQLAEFLPKHKDWIEDAISRLIDLYDVFKKFDYYNPKQCGSASIKKVLPALVGKDYSGLNISKGDQASLSFIKMRQGISKQEEIDMRFDLMDYCGQDTEAMVWIIQELRKLIN